jgi:hypothetical protein
MIEDLLIATYAALFGSSMGLYQVMLAKYWCEQGQEK